MPKLFLFHPEIRSVIGEDTGDTALFKTANAEHPLKDNTPNKMNHLIQILKAGALYFALVFGIGAALGTARVLWLAPRYGTRKAELMESPVMLAVIILTAEWIVRRSDFSATLSARLLIGVTALVMMVVAELMLVLQMAGLSINDYLASRDPVAAAVYYVLLGLFGIMPMLVARGRIPAESGQ